MHDFLGLVDHSSSTENIDYTVNNKSHVITHCLADSNKRIVF